MNAYGQGQVYSARASTSTATCNMAGFYVPHYYHGNSGVPPPQPKPATTSSGTQSQAQPATPPKRSCDVATQADLIPEEASEAEPVPASDEDK